LRLPGPPAHVSGEILSLFILSNAETRDPETGNSIFASRGVLTRVQQEMVQIGMSELYPDRQHKLTTFLLLLGRSKYAILSILVADCCCSSPTMLWRSSTPPGGSSSKHSR